VLRGVSFFCVGVLLTIEQKPPGLFGVVSFLCVVLPRRGLCAKLLSRRGSEATSDVKGFVQGT